MVLPLRLVLCRSVGQQRTVAVVGAEPEHQRVVLRVFADEGTVVEHQALLSIEFYAQSCWHTPCGAFQHQVGTAQRLVDTYVAATFAQREVIEQARFVARQALLGIPADLFLAKGLVPQTELQHGALIGISVFLD